MSSMRRHKKVEQSATQRPDYLDSFLAQPADEGTTDDDVKAVAKADADRAAEQHRIDQYLKTEEVFDRNAPRPSTRDAPR
jgi:hypothetical protein